VAISGGHQIALTLQNGQGPAGPAGPQGVPGIAGALELKAAQALGGHRVVIAVGADGCDYADATNPAHFARVIGMTTGAAAAGALVTVQTSKSIDNAGWAWTPNGDLWLSANGLLTQTIPTGGAFVQPVGFALTPTRVWIDLTEPVLN
jgi:hypothetical protein